MHLHLHPRHLLHLLHLLHSIHLPILALTLVGWSRAFGTEIRIATPSDFYSFASSGDSYEGTTVLLTSDITLSTTTTIPISNFRGVFDGQGHIINNLTVVSSTQYAGLFGYSDGLTIRNVVLGSSCTVTNTFSDTSLEICTGGIIGRCDSTYSDCNILNCVNAGSIYFRGSSSGTYLGGIAAYIYTNSTTNTVYIRNCANYGNIENHGTCGNLRIAGIVGLSYSTSDKMKYIENCLNYGELIHNGTVTNDPRIGGIIGHSYYTYIKYCLSAGKFTSTTLTSNCGSIVGRGYNGNYVQYCYHTSDMDYKIVNAGQTTDTTGSPSAASTAAGAVSGLNSAIESDSTYNRWVSNPSSAGVTIYTNSNGGFYRTDQAILLPTPIPITHSFSGWFTDKPFSIPFTTSSSVVSDTTSLYGGWAITVTYDANGGSITTSSSTAYCGSTYSALPEAEMTEYTFLGWFTEGNELVTNESTVNIEDDHTLYAKYIINNYTVTFLSDGSVVKSEQLDYQSNITYPDNLTKAGYRFAGWNSSITSVPDHNVVIEALWEEIVTEFVEIVFGTKDLTKGDVERVVGQYTNAGFTIAKYEDGDETGGIRVIIKFDGTEDAQNFVRRARAAGESSYITKIGFCPEEGASACQVTFPRLLFNFFVI